MNGQMDQQNRIKNVERDPNIYKKYYISDH